ncbi:hypothetical protein K469DRAFT_781553 [Zopfia rhizophila CBS 207.26]|uniref:Uncharacterized protein n=1 Tax=Zopfia rhizophila CBS 207.26 TaxID=1314779 RepID=A0A6A6DXE7_9PEZI|nr:hypothetical protein K469DRAFT_781553 [Zopfia rhizophila CBS 207.26]
MASTNGSAKQRKQLILNTFATNAPAHLAQGLWRPPSTTPQNKTSDFNKLKFWTDLAQLLDKANLHELFIADFLGPYDFYKGLANVDPILPSGVQFPIHDPLYLVPAMAAVT